MNQIGWRDRGGGLIASTVISAAAAGLSFYLLLTIRFSVGYLTLVYLTYTVALSVLAHCIFFMACSFDLQIKKRQISKKVPRYLDYAYTLIVSAAILQIFVVCSKNSRLRVTDRD
jgi:hypothetical protein